ALFQPRMFLLMIVQAPAAALLAVAVLLAARNPDPSFRVADALGVAILVAAIGGEALADAQMKRFKAATTDRSAVCDQGLWAWSRHPNYFFEALGWLAYPAMAIDFRAPWTFVSLIAPV